VPSPTTRGFATDSPPRHGRRQRRRRPAAGRPASAGPVTRSVAKGGLPPTWLGCNAAPCANLPATPGRPDCPPTRRLPQQQAPPPEIIYPPCTSGCWVTSTCVPARWPGARLGCTAHAPATAALAGWLAPHPDWQSEGTGRELPAEAPLFVALRPPKPTRQTITETGLLGPGGARTRSGPRRGDAAVGEGQPSGVSRRLATTVRPCYRPRHRRKIPELVSAPQNRLASACLSQTPRFGRINLGVDHPREACGV
jgi:hypothetical protein